MAKVMHKIHFCVNLAFSFSSLGNYFFSFSSNVQTIIYNLLFLGDYLEILEMLCMTVPFTELHTVSCLMTLTHYQFLQESFKTILKVTFSSFKCGSVNSVYILFLLLSFVVCI